MPRRRKDCPICGKRNLVKLSNHLADTHQLSGETRRYYLSKVKPLGDQNLSEDMSSRKRMRDDWNDGMSIDRLQSTPSWLTFETHGNHKVSSIHYF